MKSIEVSPDFRLYGRRISGISSDQVTKQICEILGSEGTMIAWSPSEVIIGRVNDTHILNSEGHAVNLNDVYGLRAFSQDRDIRWTATLDGGDLVVISENQMSDVEGANVDRTDFTSKIVGVKYVVVGEKFERDDIWTYLSAANIGSIAVPVSGEGRRVVMESIEYVACDQDGNADVTEERIFALSMMGDDHG